MSKKNWTALVTWKDPDFLYGEHTLTKKGEEKIHALSDCGDYFAVELEINPSGDIVSARFVQA